MKVFIASYTYTETYCSPHPENWEKAVGLLIVTLDESLAQEACDKHNHADKWNKASIKSYDLAER